MKKVSIIVTRYNEPNSLINPCLVALSKQKDIVANVYFLDQKKDKKIKSFCEKLSSKNIKIIYKNIPAKSLSYARNKGISLSKTEIILFIDADAIPLQDWAFELAKIFNSKKKIAVVGGKTNPKWLINPKWYHNSNILMETYSDLDLGGGIKEVDRITGGNAGLNKKILKEETFFDENLGRRPGSLLSGEECDLCKRTKKKGFRIFYNGNAIIQHQIQKERMNLSWVMKRFYWGGYGRAIMGGMPKTYTNKRNIYDKLILMIIFIPYLIGFLRGKMKCILVNILKIYNQPQKNDPKK